jgi:cobalamin synthase
LVGAVLRGTGVFMMAWVAIFGLSSKNYFQRRLGGVTGDTFGAVGELSETSVFVFLALGAK